MTISEPVRRVALVLGLVVATGGILAAMFSSSLEAGDRLWPLSWMAWGPVGFAILYRRPGNAVGRGMMFIAVTMGISFSTLALAVADLPLSVRMWAEVVNTVSGVAPWLGIVWLILVFPASTYPGRAERLVGRLLAGYGLFAATLFVVSPAAMAETGVPSPLAVEAAGPLAAIITGAAGFLGVIVLLLAALVLLFRRWRRSSGLERAQFRWLFYGAAGFLIVLATGQWLPEDAPGQYLWLPAGLLIPVTIGVAILRYRLFEIDRIISRTLTYAVVAGLLSAVYIGVVAALTFVLPSDDPFVVAVATLAAAALFNPFRRRVQKGIDRRFNRSRYNAERIVDSFSLSLREGGEPADLIAGLVTTVASTMQPGSVGVWLRDETRTGGLT
ncbi:MAG TPA: hypothetical protein VHL52_09900 [Acidimicrobiia bacterium]|nr:hypothetical protein [Acidimicrobiia bacterium]